MIYIYRKGTSTNESLQTCLSVAPQKVFSGHPEYEICCQTYNLCRPNHSVKKQKPNKQEKETKPLKELFEKNPRYLIYDLLVPSSDTKPQDLRGTIILYTYVGTCHSYTGHKPKTCTFLGVVKT